MKAFLKIMNGLTIVEKVLASILLAVVSVVTFGSVLARMLPTVSWSFTEELVINLFVPLSLLGAALCARDEGGLISMALFTNFLPRKGQRIMNLLMVAFGLFFCFILTKYGIAKAATDLAMNKTTYILVMKIGIFTATIPACAVLMGIHLIEFAIVNIYALVKGEEALKEVQA